MWSVLCRRSRHRNLFYYFLATHAWIKTVLSTNSDLIRGGRGRDRMLVGFITTYAISA